MSKNNTPKFTPGPWIFNRKRVENSKYGTMGWLIELHDDGRVTPIATTYNDSEKDEANAYIIAASPCMYETVLATERHFLADGTIEERELSDAEKSLLKMIRKTLSKVRGE